MAAAGTNPNSLRKNGHTPISYITSLQQANGAIRYSRTSAQTPVWVTGQALTALARQPFPVPAPRRKAPVVPAKAATAPKSKPKAKANEAKAVPIAHAAAKKKQSSMPTSHGQTIATKTLNPATRHPPPATLKRTSQPTTTHEGNHHPLLGNALGALAVATLLAGGYLTRKHLRGRPA
jgi:hypothetical protein